MIIYTNIHVFGDIKLCTSNAYMKAMSFCKKIEIVCLFAW